MHPRNGRNRRGCYLGVHRAPSPPRSRYAAVVTSAVVGAGIVALGASSALPDSASSPDTSELAALTPEYTPVPGQAGGMSEDRAELADRSTRSGRTQELPVGAEQQVPDIWVLPVKDYTFTSEFGQRWGRLHGGIDLAGPTGTPIYAANDGRVIYAGWADGYGYLVKIDHGNGVVTYYGHNSEILVEVGDWVTVGQQISEMGSTGFSTGPHLHFEVRINGERIDPVPYLLERGVDVVNHTDSPYI